MTLREQLVIVMARAAHAKMCGKRDAWDKMAKDVQKYWLDDTRVSLSALENFLDRHKLKIMPVEATEHMLLDGLNQISWSRSDQVTNCLDHPTQRTGTSCGEDLRDAWRRMSAVAPNLLEAGV